ncbi:MAG: carboxymuconolactone decarboxylase family protein [Planctomycetes bacterium]|nr:carboxymuconolactone decarboxylase family protein [Planctomycetota bacterium]
MAPRKRGPRARRVTLLARIAGLAALGREAPLEAAFRRARREGVAVNALEALDRALGGPRPGAPERIPGGAARRGFLRRRGEGLFGRVYGEDAGRVLDRIGRRHPEFRDWILEDAYGKVLSRPGLGAAERECIAVALLAVLDLPRQQAAHLRGALRCGARGEEVAAAIRGVAGLAPPGALDFARGRLREARARATPG